MGELRGQSNAESSIVAKSAFAKAMALKNGVQK